MTELAQILAEQDTDRVIAARYQSLFDFIEDSQHEKKKTPSWIELMMEEYVFYTISPTFYLSGEKKLPANPVHRMHTRIFRAYASCTLETVKEFSFYDSSTIRTSQILSLRQCGGMEWINTFEQRCIYASRQHMAGLVDAHYADVTTDFFRSMFASEAESWRVMLRNSFQN